MACTRGNKPLLKTGRHSTKDLTKPLRRKKKQSRGARGKIKTRAPQCATYRRWDLRPVAFCWIEFSCGVVEAEIDWRHRPSVGAGSRWRASGCLVHDSRHGAGPTEHAKSLVQKLSYTKDRKSML